MLEFFDKAISLSLARRQSIDVVGSIYLISAGYIGLYSANSTTKVLILILKPNDIFPLIPVRDKKMRSIQVHFETLTKVTLKELPLEDFENHIHENKAESQKLMDKITERNMLMLQRIMNLTEKNVSQRLKTRLIFLADYLGKRQNGKINIMVPLAYEDLASSIGTTRETVNRLMSTMQKDNILSVNNKTITINSIEALKISSRREDYH